MKTLKYWKLNFGVALTYEFCQINIKGEEMC